MSDSKVSELLEGITPGTWEAKPNKYQEGQWLVQAGMPSNRVLARFGDRDELDETDLANARLIAAAPRIAREHASLTLEVAQLKQRVAGTVALALRNHEAGDWRMLKENLVSLGFAAEHGRYPDCNEIVAAFAALKESPHVR